MKKKDKKFWIRRLKDLYDEAKARNGGNSLTIYDDVNTALNYLEDFEEVPEGIELNQYCDALAARLRRA